MSGQPLVPRTNQQLVPGQFWSIPLSDGRYGCGRVLAVGRSTGPGARTRFIAAIHDWVGAEPPTADAIAGAPLLAVGNAHVRTIAESGGAILGERPLDADGITVPAGVSTYWGFRYPALRAEQRFVLGDPVPDHDWREVASPLTGEMLRPALTGRGVVQFARRLADADFAALGIWFRDYPDMTLRAYGSYDGSIRDLEFLRFFPSLRRFAADAMWDSLESIEGLRHLRDDAEELSIGWTRKRLDLSVLARFRALRTLFLEGQTKHIEVLSSLTALEDLTLRSISLPDLSLLLPLERLLSLDVKLGGTRDLSLLPRIGHVRYLELWLIRGLTDIAPVGELTSLRYLFLQALKQVERIPDLRRCEDLRRIHLETMRGIRDLGPLTTAPALEELVLIDMPQLRPEDLRPLIGLPRLRAVTYGLGSLRKRDEARAIVGLPEVEHQFDWRRD